MCRLFGMHAGAHPATATFWLLEAPDSLSEQSRHNPDGAGIGTFTPYGTPVLHKEPLAAWQDADFATAAHDLRGTTFVAHVRYASTGGLSEVNTHPFLQDGRLFAHNGVLTGLDQLDVRLAELGVTDLVHGDTDSERMFALITAETRVADGDLGAGIVTAISWIAARLPLFALNIVLTTPTEMWALRYPDTHDLWVLSRPAGGTGTDLPLDAHSSRIRARSDRLADAAAVIVATERMDADPGWRLLGNGELLRIPANLNCTSTFPFAAPAHQLSLADLEPAAAVSQRHAT